MPIATLLAAAAAAPEKPTPLIDIDGTLLVQFGIFVAMYLVLRYLVFSPYLGVQKARGDRIEGARADAKAMQEKAAAMLIDYEARLTKARQRGAEERNRLRAEGQVHEREVLGRAREIGQKALAEARTEAAAQRESARTKLLGEASEMGRRIAARVLGREIA